MIQKFMKKKLTENEWKKNLETFILGVYFKYLLARFPCSIMNKCMNVWRVSVYVSTHGYGVDRYICLTTYFKTINYKLHQIVFNTKNPLFFFLALSLSLFLSLSLSLILCHTKSILKTPFGALALAISGSFFLSKFA